MATVKTKWRSSTIESKAGTIYYQIIHNRIVRQLKTEYKIFEDEWNYLHGAFNTASIDYNRNHILLSIQNQMNCDLKQLNAIIERFDNCKNLYTTDDIITTFLSQLHKQSISNFMHSVITRLKYLNKHRTAENYITTLNSFMQFRNYEDLLLNEFNSDLMMQYEAYLIGRGVTKNTISFYMRILRAVYNRAVEQELTEQRNPFKHVYTGIDKTVKRAISFDAIKRIKELDLSSQPVLDFARDMFLFSFYMRGMSFIDMAYLKKTDLKYGTIIYCRHKTGQRLAVKWEQCMQDIVDKSLRSNRYYQVSKYNPYLLPILKHTFDNNYGMYRSKLQQINKSLKIIARLARIDIPLTMHVARHSWASIARTKHIPISIISEGMGHNSETTTRIYLASLDSSVIDHANSIIRKGL